MGISLARRDLLLPTGLYVVSSCFVCCCSSVFPTTHNWKVKKRIPKTYSWTSPPGHNKTDLCRTTYRKLGKRKSNRGKFMRKLSRGKSKTNPRSTNRSHNGEKHLAFHTSSEFLLVCPRYCSSHTYRLEHKSDEPHEQVKKETLPINLLILGPRFQILDLWSRFWGGNFTKNPN